MLSNIRLTNKLWVLISIPLISELLFVGSLLFLWNRAETLIIEEQHSREVIDLTKRIQETFFQEIQILVNYGIAPSDLLRKKSDNILEKLPRQVSDLKRMTNRHGRSKSSEREMTEAVAQVTDAMDKSIAAFINTKKQLEESLAFTHGREIKKTLSDLTSELFPALERIAAIERRSAVSVEQRNLHQFINYFETFGLAINIITVLFLVALVNRVSISDRMLVLVSNADKFANRNETVEPLNGSDEFASLDDTFRKMATSIKASTRRERTLIDNTTDVICSLSKDLRFISVSPASTRLWGIAPDTLKETHIKSILQENSQNKFEASLNARDTQQQIPSFECMIQKPSGETVATWWSASWSDEEQAYFCVVHDVTERKELERRRKELVAIVSHDLRSPLTSVLGTLNILSEGIRGELPAPVMKDVRDAEKNVMRLVRLIKDVLDMEKMESGKMEIGVYETDVLSLIEQSVESVRQLASDADVSLTIDAADDLFVFWDGDRIIQVIVNLLSNSIKFSPKNGTVSIRARVEGEMVTVKVEDQGPGIPADFKDKIFDRFQQVDGRSKKAKAGTGLGLAIAQEIVALHHGQIGVDSTAGEGSTFWFKLPVNIAQANS
ncbi:MAG: PAS domain S-box protein [Candidatus Obscuribacterales bacterium]|jgi:PAS domain S-box-containing protein|nr:PAS domain S-box protein [Candidatus Obscuribacterales bacterium]